MEGRRTPVTLLSGFLGAGKSTLLQHILNNAEGLKCAVLINDMASTNIDASQVVRHSVAQARGGKEPAQMVRLQNGCVCCTLSDEMVTEVAQLARQGRFDYIIIESSGVAEPSETAGFLTHGGLMLEGAPQALRDLVYVWRWLSQDLRVDTCVTVVDAACLMEHLHSVDCKRENSDVDPHSIDASESTHFISQLLVDQIEFADVVVLNKQDLVTPADLEVAHAMLLRINANAKIICASFAEVPLVDIVNARRFDYDKTSLGAAWLHARASDGAADTGCGSHAAPEAARDGQGAHSSCADPGCQDDAHASASSGHDDHGACQGKHEHSGCEGVSSHALPHPPASRSRVVAFTYKARTPFHPQRVHDFMQAYFVVQQPEFEAAEGQGAAQTVLDRSEAAARQAARTAAFGGVMRSKGFAWVAGAVRRDHCVDWNSAGNVLRFGTGGPWFAVLPREQWPADNIADIEGDFDADPAVGDRRQEIVFIGIDMNEEALRAALDACLCKKNEEEEELSDPLAWWPDVHEMMGEEDVET